MLLQSRIKQDDIPCKVSHQAADQFDNLKRELDLKGVFLIVEDDLTLILNVTIVLVSIFKAILLGRNLFSCRIIIVHHRS